VSEYGVKGVRDDINTGVWVDKKKITADGVSSSGWTTTHGIALNIDPDLNFFDTSMILPCGIEGRGVTSITRRK
jgi:lipoate-protein ligase B